MEEVRRSWQSANQYMMTCQTVLDFLLFPENLRVMGLHLLEGWNVVMDPAEQSLNQ